MLINIMFSICDDHETEPIFEDNLWFHDVHLDVLPRIGEHIRLHPHLDEYEVTHVSHDIFEKEQPITLWVDCHHNSRIWKEDKPKYLEAGAVQG